VSFSTILGQEGAIRLIRKALSRHRVPHAYLFTGPEGVGKKLTALTLAKALNCLEASGDACDACKSCNKIDSGNHPDVGVIEADGQFIKIGQVRELQKQVSYKPFEGRRKVFILNDAEKLNLEAANALLKTLEEPPPETLFILVTSNPEALLPTILSRCQPIRFSTLGRDRLRQFILEKKPTALPKVHLLVALSEGRPGRALSIDEDKISTLREQVVELMDLLLSNDQKYPGGSLTPSRMRVLFQKIEEFARDRDATEELLDFLLLFYRDLLILSEQGSPHSLTNQDMIPRLGGYLGRVASPQILKICQDIYQTKANLQHNANLQLALEGMFLKIVERSVQAKAGACF